MSTSTVSATIQDPSGQVFANGSWQLIFKPNPNVPGLFTDGGVSFTHLYGGVLDATGSFSQANVNRNDTIAPAGSLWTLIVVPNANGQAFSVDLNINSGAFNASTLINAVITNILVPATPIAHAYKDIEVILVPSNGSQYYDQINQQIKVWDIASSGFVAFPAVTSGVFVKTNPTAPQTITGQALNHINSPLNLDLNSPLTINSNIALSGNIPTSPPLAANGGALNVQKTTGGTSIYNTRIIDAFGNTNQQIIGLDIEQLINPPSNVNYLNFGLVVEMATPLTNSAQFTGGFQTANYGSFSHFGSGSILQLAGMSAEGFNSGPATATVVAGIVATANNGGVAVVGIPGQTLNPTNNGIALNLRAVDATVKNFSTGLVTNAAALYAEAAANSGGGGFTNVYGLFVADQTVGTNKWAIKTGVGKVEFGDIALCDSTLQINATQAIGTAPVASTGLLVFQPNNLSGTGQLGIQSAIQTTSTATVEGSGISVRADTAAAAYTQALNTGLHVGTPTVGVGSTITEWNGVRIEKAPTSGTQVSLKIAGSTSGFSGLNAPATGGVVNTLPSTAGTLAMVVASGTATLTSNAALAAVTSQAAITVAGAGILATDAIDWAYASAPGAGDSLCHISPYVTAGNVNFVRTNPTAAAQNVSAIVIDWVVRRS